MISEQREYSEMMNILNLLWRRKWLILIPFLLIGSVVTLWALYLPNLYRSSTSIFIEPQRVPSEYVRSTVTTDIESRLRNIRQQLTSRTKLLKVINSANLYPEALMEGVSADILVARMRKNLTVEVPPESRNNANLFTVHFVHSEPRKAMLAVSQLVSLFMEESLQVRELQAKGTTAFIEEELASLKAVLEKQEKAVQAYKERYMGELPDQLEANLSMLDNLQIQLSDNLESQREVENRVIILEQELSRMEGNIVGDDTSDDGTGPVNITLTQLMEERELVRQKVASLEASYTERHPDLIAAKKQLASIDETIRKVRASLAASESEPRVAPMPPSTTFGNELNNLRRQLNENKPRLASLQQEEVDLRGNILRYQRRVEAAPAREQQLLRLTRDYENTKENYEDLLNKKLEAQLSENLEKRQQGERFQILDTANLPEEPYLPNRRRLIIMGVGAGLGIGLGLAFLLEAFFQVFYSLRQLQNVVEAPIVIGIPFIPSRRERLKRAARGAVVTVMLLMVFFGALYYVDKEIISVSEFTATVVANLKGLL